jgi:cysteinyl-tRNA synthetase
MLLRNLSAAGIEVKISADGWISADATHSDRTREVRSLVEARNAARKAKNFKEADRIRDELTAMGIQLKDSKDPKTGEIVTTWEVKR